MKVSLTTGTSALRGFTVVVTRTLTQDDDIMAGSGGNRRGVKWERSERDVGH